MIQHGEITLRAADKNDIKLFHKWSNDYSLRTFIGPQLPTSLDEQEKIFERNQNNENRKVLIIINASIDIGYIYLDFDWQNSKVALSIAIGEKDYQNKGLGKDSVLAALNLVFDNFKFNKCYLYVFTSNIRAIKLYEKCGFKKEGILRQDYQINGSYQDRLIMSLLREEFLDYKLRIKR